jgi:hypothetical protein
VRKVNLGQNIHAFEAEIKGWSKSQLDSALKNERYALRVEKAALKAEKEGRNTNVARLQEEIKELSSKRIRGGSKRRGEELTAAVT